MEIHEIKEYQRKLLGDPDNGVEPEMSIEDMDPESEEYKAIRPFAKGEAEWPEAEEVLEETLPVEEIPAEDPPADEPVINAIDAPAVVEARDRIAARETSRTAYEEKVTEHTAVLDEPEPDDVYSDEHADWRKRQRAANKGLAEAQREYLRARDTEDTDIHKSVVQKHQFSDTIREIGESFPELKLPEPYEVMEGKYNAWATRAMAETDGDLNAAYAKFQSDPEFAKKIGPLPEGHEKLFIYMNAVAAQKKDGGPIDGHIMSLARREGVFSASRKQATDLGAQALAGATKNADALQKRSTEARPANIKGGSQTAPVAIVAPNANTTDEQDMAWLEDYQVNKLGKPRTAAQIQEDTRMRDLVMQKLAKSEARSYA